ncbi:hypothetical protein CAPTEDRAFT_223292 [Capitella teleta]|uniref:Fe2OG dioxygenase domain-containing protein n=1 Tax=Capitella teleta TaxID=283909 RepID=R7V530_CAPTE|nr:hypothetical protein CAPTEDRAFT_223292 [Capitella teleta]|eukprot:ELU13968.1 hypothetical protein CAPTEDRAFT_223292 [Capitella teleta]
MSKVNSYCMRMTGAMEKPDTKLIDISPLVNGLSDEEFRQPANKKICQELVDELSEFGCVLLCNHGVPAESFENLHRKTDQFFAQDVAFKEKFARRGPTIDGWTGQGVERLGTANEHSDKKLTVLPPGDLKEVYNVSNQHPEASNWPDVAIPGFKESYRTFYSLCTDLSQVVLKALAVGLGLNEVDFFSKAHLGNSTTWSNVRCAYHPPIPEGAKILEGQIRCGEHTDFDSITLNFQDGGLEILDETTGKWWFPRSVPGTVLVSCGDFMQRWTSDRIKAVVHRVGVPDDAKLRQSTRKSIIFFVHPDNEWMIECCDGSNKYPPVKSIDYFQPRLDALY